MTRRGPAVAPAGDPGPGTPRRSHRGDNDVRAAPGSDALHAAGRRRPAAARRALGAQSPRPPPGLGARRRLCRRPRSSLSPLGAGARLWDFAARAGWGGRGRALGFPAAPRWGLAPPSPAPPRPELSALPRSRNHDPSLPCIRKADIRLPISPGSRDLNSRWPSLVTGSKTNSSSCKLNITGKAGGGRSGAGGEGRPRRGSCHPPPRGRRGLPTRGGGAAGAAGASAFCFSFPSTAP